MVGRAATGRSPGELMGYAFLLFSCSACGATAHANPTLVMSVLARWDGTEFVPDPNARREPICESCARQLLERFERERLPVPSVVRQPDYFERAYHGCADEWDLW